MSDCFWITRIYIHVQFLRAVESVLVLHCYQFSSLSLLTHNIKYSHMTLTIQHISKSNSKKIVISLAHHQRLEHRVHEKHGGVGQPVAHTLLEVLLQHASVQEHSDVNTCW